MAQCPVCLRTALPRASLCELRCNHVLCNECITKLQNGNCPICRRPIFPAPEAPPSSVDDVEDLLRHSLQEFLDHTPAEPSMQFRADEEGGAVLRDVFPSLMSPPTTVQSPHFHSNVEDHPHEGYPEPDEFGDASFEAPGAAPCAAPGREQVNVFIFTTEASVDRIVARVLQTRQQPT